MSTPAYVETLRAVVEQATPLLLELDAETAARPRAPGKWSPCQIVGHLIDSASNNHQRFVRAQFTDDLVFPGYDQDAWVTAQRYQETDWRLIVTLWQTFNLHLAGVMASVPEAARTKPRPNHNLDQLASVPVPRSEPATLDYFMADYVGHLRHHLGQILGDRLTDAGA